MSLQGIAAGILNGGTSDSTILAQYLSLFIRATTNLNGSSSSLVSINRIDNVVGQLNATDFTVSSNSSFLMAQGINQSGSTVVRGAAFTRGSGGQVVNSANQNSVLLSAFSAAAFLSNQSSGAVLALNMFIIDRPTMFENVNSSNNQALASSVIVLSTPLLTGPNSTQIDLYFTVLSEYQPTINVTYLCSFYNTTIASWSQTGCSLPSFDSSNSRYYCSCNHTTTYALTYMPSTMSTTTTTTTTTTTITTSTTVTTTSTSTSSSTATTTTTTESTSSTSTITSTSTRSQTTTPIPFYSPEGCNSSSLVQLTNGTCVSNSVGQV